MDPMDILGSQAAKAVPVIPHGLTQSEAREMMGKMCAFLKKNQQRP